MWLSLYSEFLQKYRFGQNQYFMLYILYDFVMALLFT